ncbi:MAG: HU family DNA-binding protein [Planctomycetes bacterium]|nr:HU family DNA-binding protein [Planctomycetota bacterium]
MAKKKKANVAAKKAPIIKNRFNKTQILSEIAESTSLSKKQVGAVMEELGCIVERHVRKGAAGEFVIPGMLKIKTIKKPATKARKGTNPFTGEEMMFKAKPATVKVKVLPLKALKEMVL